MPAETALTDPREALRYSRFAQRLLAAQPALDEEVGRAAAGGWTAEAMRSALGDLGEATPEALATALRKLRNRVLLRLALRDLSNRADLAEVVGTMTDLAEVTIGAAHAYWTRRLEAELGTPMAAGVRQSLLVIGMGKLGGRELNVSSDIDLIFAYPEEGETTGDRDLSNHEFFIRLGRRLVATLNDVTEDGRVFRVDMRLRPWGDSGPLAASFEALEQYFLTQGREWERYAWIKARVVAGDAPTARDHGSAELDALSRPFIYRKYLDFATVSAIRSLHAQIRQEVARRDLADHVKLGPGGIREIEFIAQAFQLIRGGRDASLQVRPTLEVLALLGRKGQISDEAAAELSAAYDFLRRLEHRLQYLDDAQTHMLPAGEEDRQLVAESMGFADWPAFCAALAAVRANVSRHFENVIAVPEGAPSETAPVWLGTVEPEAAVALLEGKGYTDPASAVNRLQAMRASVRYRQLSSESQERVDRLVPRLVEEAARTPHPDATLARGLDLVESIGRRAAYLALLAENPQALGKVAELMGASRWAADYLASHPILLDELLDARLLATAPDWVEFGASLRRAMADQAGDTERQMDLMRELHHAAAFRLLTQDLAGLLTVEQLADHLSLAADLVLSVTVDEAWKLVRTRHRETPHFAVIGYGKLGGKELGYASDLDLVFVYDDEDPAAAENYTKLVHRINNWLSARSAAGVLFETDLRLRPSGESGLLVTSLAAFRDYQLRSAWVWEHQALTRARFCAGDAAIGALFEALRRDILTAERDRTKLREEVLTMRQRMLDGHPNPSELFDLKHDRGGMVDIEFIVQFLVLAHAREHYELTGNLGNITLLRIAGAVRLIPDELAREVSDAYREYRRRQHRLRLDGAEFARVDHDEVGREIRATRALWKVVFGRD